MTVTPIFAPGEQEVIPQYESYLDPKEDVRPWLQFGETPSNAEQEAKLRMITEQSCYWVQNYLGKTLAPVTVKRRFSGWPGFNGAILELPYYPVLKMGRVIEWWGVSGPHELLEQTPVEQIGAEAYQVDPLRGYLIRTFIGLVQRPWFPGSRNIEVEWEAGYNPIPPDIKKATLSLIAHEWHKEQQASQAGGPRPAGMPVEQMQEGYFGEPPEVRKTLDLYRQIGIG